MIYITAYIVVLALFLLGWKRWGDRMARMDADMEQAAQQMRLQRSYDAVDYTDR